MKKLIFYDAAVLAFLLMEENPGVFIKLRSSVQRPV
jgi:hypothetical protein